MGTHVKDGGEDEEGGDDERQDVHHRRERERHSPLLSCLLSSLNRIWEGKARDVSKSSMSRNPTVLLWSFRIQKTVLGESM